MIIPVITRDYPLYTKEEASPSSFGLRRMLTPIFFQTQDEMDFYDNNGKSPKEETPDSYYLTHLATSSYASKNNLKYSLMAGIFQGLGGSAVAAEALTPSSVARLAVPAALAFETHYALSNALYQGVFQEEKPSKLHQANKTPIGIFENVLNYELHIVAGATAGLVYSVAHTSMLQESLASSATKAKTATKMLGFAALFGGYDFYSDVFGSLLVPEEDQPVSSTTSMAVIGLAGGFASMTQASILGLRRNMVSMRRMQFASETATAARYATAATTMQASVSTPRLVRAFVPGMAAFLVYERFGTFMNAQTS